MPDNIEQGTEQPENPAHDVLGWTQKQVFTYPQAYYHEGYNEKIIDQMWGGDGVWLWVGLGNEGGDKYKLKGENGLELEVVEMAHVTIERSDSDRKNIDIRWLKILLVDGSIKVHMHHFGKDYTEGAEVSEYRFLEDYEAADVCRELQDMATV